MKKNVEHAVDFYDLKWDSNFFKVNSAKAILKRPLTLNEWEELNKRVNDYEFISILNSNSEPVNAQLIGKNSSAFLADVNIQFMKRIDPSVQTSKNITFHQALGRNNRVIEIADFQFSKFTEDLQLAKRGGKNVYRQWLINSFNNPDKFFALSKDETGEINGFLLHHYTKDTCVIELIAVQKSSVKGGLGTSLFKAIEYEAYKRGLSEIRVGTQVRNMGAINFYQKVGCKQVGCHQVYHLWNL